MLHLLDLDRLNGTTPGRRARGSAAQLHQISTPGGASCSALRPSGRHAGRVFVFVADAAAPRSTCSPAASNPRLHLAARTPTPGRARSSPAGSSTSTTSSAGAVRVYEPTQLTQLISLPAATGHWNSPIVIGGRVIVPEGDANEHATHGTLDIFHLPGR